MKINCYSSSLKLALILLLAGGLSVPALANFSPIDQPLESDWFIALGSATIGAVTYRPDNRPVVELQSTRSWFIGKNLLHEDHVVAGLVGSSAQVTDIAFAQIPEGLVQATLPAGEAMSLQAYLAYQSNKEDLTGLRAGATVGYVIGLAREEIADNGVVALKSFHAIAANIDEAFTVRLGESPILLTQFAKAVAIKPLTDDNSTIFLPVAGLKLAADFNNFLPFVSVDATGIFANQSSEFLFGIDGGCSWNMADNIDLEFNTGLVFLSTKPMIRSSLGLDLLF